MKWLKENKLFTLTLAFVGVSAVGVLLQVPLLLMLGVPMFAAILIGGLVKVIRWMSRSQKEAPNG